MLAEKGFIENMDDDEIPLIATIIDREMGGWLPIEEWNGEGYADIWAGNERFTDCYKGIDGKPRRIVQGMSIGIPYPATHFRPLPQPPK